ncbi:stalk domain-containing protein [Chengkuizengella marina]|nr:stalk domain-containing protein [Chengkuizengella marina]
MKQLNISNLTRSVLLVSVLILLAFFSMSVNAKSKEDTHGIWTQVESMNHGKFSFENVELNGKIFVIGGKDRLEFTRTMEVYDPQINKWTQLANMSVPRNKYGSNTVDLNGKLYIFDENAEVYDPVKDLWTKIPNYNYRESSQTVVLNGEIYLIGGSDGYERNGSALSDIVSRSVEKYNPHTNNWIEVSSLNIPRANSQIEVLEGKIYAIGGSDGDYNTLNNVEVYNPETDAWTITNLNYPKRNITSFVMNNKIYVFDNDGEGKAEVFNASKNKWEAAGNLQELTEELLTNDLSLVCTMDENIYFKQDINMYLTSIISYDVNTGIWSKVTNMYNQDKPEIMCADGTLYIIGGKKGEYDEKENSYTVHGSKRVLKYDPSSGFSININGEIQDYDNPPLLIKGTTMVPMRNIFESLGAEVTWDQSTKTITATNRDTTITLEINAREAIVNNSKIHLQQPAQIFSGNTLIPLRFVSESLGADVRYDHETKIVDITIK